MLSEETQQKLITMKMYGLSACFDEYLSESRHDKLTFEERFGLMVDREWSERQERRLSRRLKIAKLREQACVEDINYRTPRNLDRSVVQRLTKCKWIKDHENIIITGATGMGKTWLACAFANKACREGYTTIYTRVPRLLHEMKIAKADGTYLKKLTKLAKCDLLILDDIGLSPLTDTERMDILEIVEDRHENRSTIATSQLPIKKWHDTIGDPTIADAILDRLISKAHRLELKGGCSNRKPISKKK